MKFSSAIFALIATAAPAAWSLPAEPKPVPTCAAEQCLQGEPIPGLFDGCAPNKLDCICGQNQTEVTRYVKTVQKCIDDKNIGGKACTAGAQYNYKSLLTDVCKSAGKNATWVPIPLPQS
ncbi:hypothetical protein ACN47E_004647 [Coniothyrium glycines]